MSKNKRKKRLNKDSPVKVVYKKKSVLPQAIVLTAILAVIAGIFGVKMYQRMTKEPEQDTGDFSLIMQEVDLNDLKSKGYPILMSFGADFCSACKQMYPALESINEEMQEKALVKYIDTQKHSFFVGENFPFMAYIPTQIFITRDGQPYVPSSSLSDINFESYKDKSTGELLYTYHVGILTADEMRAILIDMGVE